MKKSDRRRSDHLTALSVVLLTISLLQLGTRPGHDWGDDFALYLLQARALSSGDPASVLEGSIAASALSDVAIGPPAAPWGFPIMLWAGQQVAGWDISALKMLGRLSLALAALLIYTGCRGLFSPLGSLLCVSLVAWQLPVLAAADKLGADLPFLAICAFAFTLSVSLNRDSKGLAQPRWVLMTIAGIVTVAAYATRSNGVFIPAAFGAALLASRDLRSPVAVRTTALEVSVMVGTCLLGVWWYLVFLPDGSLAHVGYLSFSPESLARRAVEVVVSLGEFFPLSVARHFGLLPTPVGAVLLIAFVLLLVLGVLRLRHRSVFLLVFGSLNVGLLLVFPADGGARYAYPLLLSFVPLMGAGLSTLAESRRLPSGPGVPRWVVVLGLVATFGFATLMSVRRESRVSGPLTPAADSMFAFVDNTVQPDAVVAFFKPRALRWFTGRLGVAITRPENLGVADVVVLNRRTEDARGEASWQVDAEDLEGGSHGAFTLIFQNGQFLVYQRDKTR